MEKAKNTRLKAAARKANPKRQRRDIQTLARQERLSEMTI